MWRHGEVVAKHQEQVGRRGLLHKAPSQERFQGSCALFDVSREETRYELEESRVENRHCRLSSQLRHASHEMHAADVVFAEVPDVIEYHEWAIGPAAHERMIESKGPYRGVDILGPQSRIGIAVARLARKTVTPQVERNQSVTPRKVRVQLATPGEPALREAVNEEDRTALGVTRFHQMERRASATSDCVVPHLVAP
jgi:hypothetical protein